MNRQRLASARRLTGLRVDRQGSTKSQSQIPPRAGAVQEAVIKALARADEPPRVNEAHAAAEELAARPLSRNTVKDCLHKNARRPDSVIERIRHGLYRHR